MWGFVLVFFVFFHLPPIHCLGHGGFFLFFCFVVFFCDLLAFESLHTLLSDP